MLVEGRRRDAGLTGKTRFVCAPRIRSAVRSARSVYVRKKIVKLQYITLLNIPSQDKATVFLNRY